MHELTDPLNFYNPQCLSGLILFFFHLKTRSYISQGNRGKHDFWTKFGNSGHSAYSRPLGKIIIKRLSAILCNEVKAFIQEFSDFHEAAISQDFFILVCM